MAKLLLVVGVVLAMTVNCCEGTVTLPQPSRLHQQGTTYTIPCQITGEDFVFWRTPAGENITLATIDPRRTVVVSGNNYGLKIENITAKDGGQYTCVGSQNSATYTAIVDYKPKVNKYQGDPVNRRLTVGSNITFHCNIKSGSPRPTITWYFGWTDTAKKVDPNYDVRYSHPTDETWTITGISTQDKGKYRCIASNIKGQDDLRFEITEVDVPPNIDPLTDVVVDENSNYDLLCKVTGNPAPTVEWLKDGVRYRDQLQTNSTKGNKIVQKISFTRIQWLSSGKYTCQARNGALDSEGNPIVAKKTISLDVNSPPKLLSSPNPIYSFVGNSQPVTVRCVFSGYPTPMVKVVFENGTEAARGKGSAFFTLKTDSKDDFGRFNCSAVNSNGKAEVSLELKILGPPRNMFATTTCKTVALKWEQPESSGYLNITNYVIILLAENNSQLFQMSVNGRTLEAGINYTKFTANTTYKVHLMARSEAGYGKEGIVIAMTKKYCVPGNPIIINSKNEVDSSFILTWSRPAYDGGDNIIKYKVEWRKKPISNATVINKRDNIGETYLGMSDLDSNGEYEFKVFAKNKAGYSKPDNRTFKVKKTIGASGPPIIYEPKGKDLDDTSFTLKWRRPDDTGGGDNIEYIVRYRDVTDPNRPGPWKDFTTKKLEYGVKGLDKGKRYKFEVIAKNKGGKSSPAERIFDISLQTGAPGPPIIYEPKGKDLDDTSFTLKWQRPDDTGGDDNIEYIVRYRDVTDPNRPGPWKDFTTKKLEYGVKALDKGKKYKFEVIAKNKGGKSSPAERTFAISLQTVTNFQSPLVASVLVMFIVGSLHLL